MIIKVYNNTYVSLTQPIAPGLSRNGGEGGNAKSEEGEIRTKKRGREEEEKTD